MDLPSPTDRLALVIVDSGLGGLSICADIVNRLTGHRIGTLSSGADSRAVTRGLRARDADLSTQALPEAPQSTGRARQAGNRPSEGAHDAPGTMGAPVQAAHGPPWTVDRPPEPGYRGPQTNRAPRAEPDPLKPPPARAHAFSWNPNLRHVELTYFNAWPEQDRGYNLLPDMAERIRVFDRALVGVERFAPDLILIACNTLSALYPQTSFSRRASVPVMDIIDSGVRLIRQELLAQPESRVVIFGTPTTIETDIHRSRLLSQGIPAERICVQPCDRLAGEIEKDPGSATVRGMIARYVGQAASQLPERRLPVLAAFCCTHYGYSRAVFAERLAAHFQGPVTILNPNETMSASLFADCEDRPAGSVCLELRVFSRIIWAEMKVASISRALAGVSPVTAQALRQYRHDPELFTF